jgi:hypothetical protein
LHLCPISAFDRHQGNSFIHKIEEKLEPRGFRSYFLVRKLKSIDEHASGNRAGARTATE